MNNRLQEQNFLLKVYITGLQLRKKLKAEHMGKTLVYLSGNIDGLSYDKALSWRNRVKELLGDDFHCLEFIDFKGQKGVSVISPKVSRYEIRKTDIELIVACDLVLMQLNDGKLTIGTIKEDTYAFWFKKPTVIWSALKKVKESAWIDSTKNIFDTLDETIRFIKKKYSKLGLSDLPEPAEITTRSVVISGQASSGKSTLAKRLASHLDLPFVDGGDALKELASLEGYEVTGKDWWDTDEGMKFLEKRKVDPQFDHRVDDILKRHADTGSVITSWTLPYIHHGPVKVWLETPKDERAMRLANRDGIEFTDAQGIIDTRDLENYNHYKNLYNIDFGVDMSPYHIVADGMMGPDEILEDVAERVSQILNKQP